MNQSPSVERSSSGRLCALRTVAGAGAAGGGDKVKGLVPDIIVITGTIPHERRHAYWRLLEPCNDLTLWRSRQLDRAERYQTDKAVTNPSRLMRIAGTVSYPNRKKLAKGYVPELTTMKLSIS